MSEVAEVDLDELPNETVITSPALSQTVQVATYLVGLTVITLAAAVYITHLDLDAIFGWLNEVFGVGFAICYVALVSVALMSGINMVHSQSAQFWYEAGMQSANAVATLALTFTLLGISLGIGSLSSQELTPDTVQDVIKQLTRHFSTAFMTTVVGLPTSSALRAFIALRIAAQQSKEETP